MDPSELDDAGLRACVARAREGDSEACNRLLAHYRPFVENYVRHRLGPSAKRWTDAEDVVQAVLIETVPQLATLPEDAEPEELLRRLYRTAGLRVQDAVRKHERQVGESVAPGSPASQRESSEGDFSMGAVTSADYRRWIHELVARLPEKYAEVVRLCAFEELSCVEAARRLKLEPDTVRKRYEVARQALDRRLSSQRRG
jgi:RNA polymerase sigma factor (sigma-70 family)